MKNFVHAGTTLKIPAPTGGAVSGGFYKTGALAGVFVFSAAEGEDVTIQTGRMFTLPKATGQAWTLGAKVYWDGSECTTTASGNSLVGFATVAAVSGATSGTVKLTAVN